MSVEGDEPNSRAPAERNVECYLREPNNQLSTALYIQIDS